MPGSARVPNGSAIISGNPSSRRRRSVDRTLSSYANGHSGQNGWLPHDSDDGGGGRVVANGYQNGHKGPKNTKENNVLANGHSHRIQESDDDAPEEVTMALAASVEATRAQGERQAIRTLKSFKKKKRKSYGQKEKEKSSKELVEDLSEDVLQRAKQAEEKRISLAKEDAAKKKLLDSAKKQSKVIRKKSKRRRVDGFDVSLHDVKAREATGKETPGGSKAEKWLQKQFARQRRISVLSVRRSMSKMSPLAFFSDE